MIQTLIGFAAFIFGSLIYLLSKIKEYKALADNHSGDVVFSFKKFLSKEWINLAQLYLGGLAIVIGLPMLAGGINVNLNNSAGALMVTFTLKEALIPMYFLIGFGGNSVVNSIFGKYKKTLLEPIGGND